jgi:hypothetical protein
VLHCFQGASNNLLLNFAKAAIAERSKAAWLHSCVHASSVWPVDSNVCCYICVLQDEFERMIVRGVLSEGLVCQGAFFRRSKC